MHENESDLTGSRLRRYHRSESSGVAKGSMKTDLDRTRWLAILAVLVCATAQPALSAQDAQTVPDSQTAPTAQTADDQDPPGRVARLNYVEGDVSLQTGGANDWIEAGLNRPLVSGDNLWADQNSRAEVHIGSTALRLGAMTGITLLEVSDHATQIRLVQGSLMVNVRHIDAEDSYEIDTPNVAFVVGQPGDYRLDVDAQGVQTDVTVWRGRGEVTGGGSSYTVVADQHVTFTGGDQLTYDVGQVAANDGLDTWAFDRDQAEDESDAANYVSPETTGYEDLDAYGDWTYIAGYGPAWRPRFVVAGWAPYRFGYWTWVGSWGWTWVAAEPWGFAPFHYGRWALSGSTWYWIPGSAAVRPVYAPALVGWVGGPGSHFSFGAGVGWFPLAPGEVFVPSYRVSRAYMNTVNLTNTHVEMTKITHVYNTVVINHAPVDLAYANRAVAGGVTVVSRDTFINARPVARNLVSVPEKELAAVPVSHGAGFEPARASVIGEGKPAAIKPPSAMASRQVVAMRTPAPTTNSFDSRGIEAEGHPGQTRLVRQQSLGTPAPMASQAGRQTQTQDGFRPFTISSGENGQAKTQPRVWEEQGTPEPPREPQPQPRTHAAPLDEMHAPQPKQSSSQQQQQQRSNPAPKPAAPVRTQNDQQQEKFSSWHQQQSWSSSASSQKSSSSGAAAKTSSSPPPPPK